MRKKRPKICTCCRVSEAKFYLYHSTKIAKARHGFDDRPEYPSVQINSSSPWIVLSEFKLILFYYILFLKGRKRNNDSASPSPPRPSKNELKNIRITIGDVSNNSKKSKKFTLLSPRTVEPNYKGY